jgi:dimethylargininase|tara:strand:+ start:951 stop:1712 length:762 start_codon:yes stop_codon:yes gene_type:complete
LFTHAIVRRPCSRLRDGLTSAELGTPDYDKAIGQHDTYIEALQQCDLRVMILPADDRFPDSTFVEDTALLTPACAITTNPGAETRKPEAELIRGSLQIFYPQLEQIEEPATLDAGDIMMVGNHFYVGLSGRTNQAGIDSLTGILAFHGMTVTTVKMRDMLHLKTGLSYLENNNLLICGEFLQNPLFDSFNQIVVPPDESYAANSVWINGTVLVPAGYPKTRAAIEQAGYETIALDVSEFQKIDGGLSCISLRF